MRKLMSTYWTILCSDRSELDIIFYLVILVINSKMKYEIVIVIIKCFHYINHPNFSYLFTFRTSLCCPTSKSSVHFLALFSYFAGLISFLFLSDTEYLKFVAVKEFSSPGYIFHNKFTTTPLLNDIPEVRHIHRRKIDYDLMSHFHQTLPL